jgi:hypothetical protein
MTRSPDPRGRAQSESNIRKSEPATSPTRSNSAQFAYRIR